MKRISYVFLAMATAVVMAGSLSSCQDYEEDMRAEMQGTQSILDELKEAVVGANGIKDALEQAEADIDDITADIAALKESQTKTDSVQDAKIAALTAQNNALQTALNNASADLQNQIDQANAKIAEMQHNHDTLAVALAALAFEMRSSYATIASVNDLTARVAALEYWKTGIDSWKGDIDSWKANVDAWKTLTDSWKADIDTWKAGIDTWKAGIDDAVNNILPAQITAALDSATAVSVIAKANAAMLEQHKQVLDSLAENDNKLAAANAATNARIDSLIAEHNTAIAAVNSSISTLNTLVSGMQGDITTIQGDIVTIKGDITTINGKLTTIDGLIEALEARVAANETLLATHTTQIADLTTRVATLETQVAELLGLKEEVSKIKNYLNQLITGILVQGTYNPIYGSLALPTNMQSNVLAAYYGKITTGLEFPSSYAEEYADPTGLVLTDDDIAMLGITKTTIAPAEVVVSDAADNAGKLYMTINPTNVDFTGTTFSLVNSLDEAAKVTLSPVAASDKKLTFGWTRAAGNGFYEVSANVAAADVDNLKARINLDDMKAAIKDVLDSENGVNVSNVIMTLYNNSSDILDAYALKAAWKDSIDDEDMAVYSHYSVAATAIKPLSYKFAQDLNVASFPGFGTIENFINEAFNSISFPGLDLNAYKFTSIGAVSLSGSRTLSVPVEIEISIAAGEISTEQTISYYDPVSNTNKTLVIPANAAYSDTLSTSVEVDLDGVYNGIETDVNSIIASINSQLTKVNDMIDEFGTLTNIFDGVADAKTSIISYLDKLNAGLCKVINSANKALQPLMVVQTVDGYSRLSTVKMSPTRVNGTNINLVPTSYTGEVLAPAYMKLVGVTNVWNSTLTADAQGGDAACIAELNSVNSHEKLAVVAPGSKETIDGVTLKSGYIYEIAYTCVDYFGKVVAKKYYVTVD